MEVVIASRAYKRNIKVFSSEYSNGVLSIENADSDRASNDDRHDCLMLAYHGNDHYNSVIRLNNKQTTSLPSPSKDKSNIINTNNPDDRNNLKDGYVNNAKEGIENRSKSNSDTTRPLTRGSDCTCGSGKKYKKCCMAKEKAKRRTTKFAAENHDSAKESGNSNHENKKDDTDDEYIGNFRVISI